MNRDDFSGKTKRLLGESVGFHCVRPGCAKPTTALNNSGDQITSIGIAAHITAASSGGPRYDELLTPAQRRAVDNGAWLCCNCARLVDVDVELFPVETLQKWQQDAIENRRQLRNLPHQPSHIDIKTAAENIHNFIQLCDQLRFLRHTDFIEQRNIDVMYNIIRDCAYLNVRNKYCALFPHLVNKQVQMVENIRCIMKEIKNHEAWYFDDRNYSYRIKNHFNLHNNEHARTKQSLVIVNSLIEDFYTYKEDLREIIISPTISLNNLYSW